MGNEAGCHLGTNAAGTSEPPCENHPAAARETEAGGGGSQGQVEVTLARGGDGAAQRHSAQAHAPFAGQQHPPNPAWAGSWALRLCSEHCPLRPAVTSVAAPGERGSTYVAYFCGKALLLSPRLRNSPIPGRRECWQGQAGPCSLLPAVPSPNAQSQAQHTRVGWFAHKFSPRAAASGINLTLGGMDGEDWGCW